MSMININELHQERQERIDRKHSIYEEVLKKCHHRIKLTAKQNPYDCMCYFVIPKVIYGIPLYNLEQCITYLYTNLTKNGFKLFYTHPNLLIISWVESKNDNKISNKIPYSNILLKKNDENNINNINNVSNFKPAGNLIYNQNSLDSLNKKKNLLLN